MDDGSNDGSGDALEQEAARDRRLRVVHTPPRGLPLALNEGLAMARAPLVARQDADDVSHRTRFELQTEALRGDRDIAIVGSRVRLFPSHQAGLGIRRWAAWHNTLLTHEQMKHERFIDIPLVHGTALLRRSWLERLGGWAERGWPEDLDLLLRLFEAGARFAKRPEILYGWRQHSSSATHRDPRYRRQRFVDLKLDALERGLLRGRETMTLVGVGDSVQRCERVFRKRRSVNVIQAGAPTPASLRGLVAPIILVFGSPHARARWREALVNLGFCEDVDFIFIA